MRNIKLSRRFSNPSALDPHEPRRKVKMISNYLSRYGKQYYDSISEINDLLDRAASHAGLKMVDYVETAVPYERSVSLLLATSHPDVFVHVSIYRRASGRYELVSYPTRSSVRSERGFQRRANPEDPEPEAPDGPEEIQEFEQVEDLPETYEDAEEVYETFHGVESDEQIEVEEAHLVRDNLAALGTLQEITLITQAGSEYDVTFENDPPLLCSTADSDQLYIIGGDQELDQDALLEILDGDESAVQKDYIWLGVVKKLVYRTHKDFDNHEIIDYEHELGEDGGLGTALIYDRLNSTFVISGGSYKIKREGIVN